jgi:hypothetical protein
MESNTHMQKKVNYNVVLVKWLPERKEKVLICSFWSSGVNIATIARKLPMV